LVAVVCDFSLIYYTLSLMLFFFFFFSSRRRHTRSDRDWSSDVCSSDLLEKALQNSDFWCFLSNNTAQQGARIDFLFDLVARQERSEERRVGKEARGPRPKPQKINQTKQTLVKLMFRFTT